MFKELLDYYLNPLTPTDAIWL